MSVSLGGVHDDAGIRGDRRTYLAHSPATPYSRSAGPGRVIGMMILEEIVRMERCIQGDRSAAMLCWTSNRTRVSR